MPGFTARTVDRVRLVNHLVLFRNQEVSRRLTVDATQMISTKLSTHVETSQEITL